MKKIFILGIVYLVLSSSYSKSSDFTQDGDKSTGRVDTTGIIFLLDNKEISSKYAVEKLGKQEITISRGAFKPKDAVVYFGEKYRNGVVICEIKTDE